MEPETCVHKRPTHVRIPSCISPVHILSSYFLEVYLNVILLSVPRFSKLSDLGFPTKTMYVPHISHMTHPLHSSWFCHPNNVWWEQHIIKLCIVQFPPVPATSSILGPIFFLSNILSSNLIIYSSPTVTSVADQVSNPYKTTGKIILLYISYFWIAIVKTEDSWLNNSRHFLANTFDLLELFPNIWMLSCFQNVWTLPHFQSIYYLSLCCDFVLHSIDDIWTYVPSSLSIYF